MTLSIFLVFFKLPNFRTISIKVAPYIKFPYVEGFFNSDKLKFGHYNNIFGGIYYVEKDKKRTYFYITNSLIRYYNSNSRPVFAIDIVSGKYKMIDLINTKYINKDPESIVVVTEQERQYFISNNLEYNGKGRHIAVIDIKNDKEIYIKRLEDEVYFDFIHPIGNSIVPIIRVDSKQIQVNLVYLSDDENRYTSWFIKDIEGELLRQVVRADDDEDEEYLFHYLYRLRRSISSRHIKEFYTNTIKYKYAIYKNKAQYIEEAIIYFDLSWNFSSIDTCHLSDVILKIKLDLDYRHIKVCLDFSEAMLKINTDEDLELENRLYENELMLEKFPFTSEIHNNKISDVLYSNDCYVIWHNTNGIGISAINQKKNQFYDTSVLSALYQYKYYWFIFRDRYLVIINTKNDSIAMWFSDTDQINDEDIMPDYNFYYLETIRVFVCISVTMYRLFHIDREGIDKALRQKNDCVEIQSENIQVFELNTMMYLLILSHYPEKSVKIGNIIGHYLDKNKNSFYFIRNYSVNNVEYTGLFECKITKRGVNFDLLSYIKQDEIYSSTHLKRLKLEKIRLYSIILSSLRESEISYSSNNQIVNLRHNRQSIILEFITKEYLELQKIKRRHVVGYDRLIALQNIISKETAKDYEIWSSFILSELSMVDKW